MHFLRDRVILSFFSLTTFELQRGEYDIWNSDCIASRPSFCARMLESEETKLSRMKFDYLLNMYISLGYLFHYRSRRLSSKNLRTLHTKLKAFVHWWEKWHLYCLTKSLKLDEKGGHVVWVIHSGKCWLHRLLLLLSLTGNIFKTGLFGVVELHVSTLCHGHCLHCIWSKLFFRFHLIGWICISQSTHPEMVLTTRRWACSQWLPTAERCSWYWCVSQVPFKLWPSGPVSELTGRYFIFWLE